MFHFLSQWDAPPTPHHLQQSTLPITRTMHACMTQIIHAQVQMCAAHSTQQMLTQSFNSKKAVVENDLRVRERSFGKAAPLSPHYSTTSHKFPLLTHLTA